MEAVICSALSPVVCMEMSPRSTKPRGRKAGQKAGKLAAMTDSTLTGIAPAAIPKPLESLSEQEIQRRRTIGRVMTGVLFHLTQDLLARGFEWMLPVMLSKSTDPLWPDPGASLEKRIELEIYGQGIRTTSSMIVHKLVACSLAYPKLFTLSPNIRIEKRERASTGMHIYEFTQLDFEVRDGTSAGIRGLVEELLCGLISGLKGDMAEELTSLGRYKTLTVPERPFAVRNRTELEREYGDRWESSLPRDAEDPVWVTNIPREFYDHEDGVWDNYDLFLPKFGEVLSGARREWEYQKIIKKMGKDKVRKENYSTLLQLAKEGRLKPSAGAGIGVERLVSWLAGAKHVGEAQVFPKIPGVVYDL
jgi:asparaginyl-tRNA synthetase